MRFEIRETEAGPLVAVADGTISTYAALRAHCELMFAIGAQVWPEESAAHDAAIAAAEDEMVGAAIDEAFRADDENRAGGPEGGIRRSPAVETAKGVKTQAGDDGLTDKQRAVRDATRAGLSLADTAKRANMSTTVVGVMRTKLRKRGLL